MDYEKKYKEALSWMQSLYNGLHGATKKDAEHFFPELKESEGEKIRKELVQFFEEKDEEDFEEWIPKAKVLAWLEKQGKQKETLCDKCKKTQPSHSCQDITALGRCALEKQGEQKLTKFEKAVKQVMEEAIECGDTHNLKADADMLLSLIHKSAWSEEDEYCRHQLIAFCENCMAQDACSKRCAHWLKSLRPQKQWKPSDEQIKVLEFFIPYVTECSVVLQKSKDTLSSLLSDLRKLREE